MSLRQGRIFQFGRFHVDASARTLRREDAIIKLNSRSFEVLLYLVRNPGKALTRDELLKNAWPDAFVDEHSLAQSISVLRRALEEKPGDNSYIVTLPGRGYQFVSEVQVVGSEVMASENGNTLQEVATADRANASGILFQKHRVETSVITSEDKEQRSSPVSQSRLLIRAVAAVLAVVAVVALLVRFRGPRRTQPNHELVERQLTANPPENSISSQALSRDGKYLAYSDFLSNNLYLLAIDSGEIRQLPLPAQYEPVDWFPDGNHLLMRANDGELWKMSTWDSRLRKLWGGNADGEEVSPDGSHIAFVKDGGVWLMGADGEEPREILKSDGEVAGAIAWSPTGQRLAYIRIQGPFAKRQATIENCDLSGGARTAVLSDPDIWNADDTGTIAWLADGRIVYTTSKGGDSDVLAGGSDLWSITADPSTGRPMGGAKRLVGWKDFRALGPQASADGKRLIASRYHHESGIYIGTFAFGNQAFAPLRFTPDTWYNKVEAWTKDSKAILFSSKRNGRWAVFKQGVDAKTPEALITGPENYWLPRLSAEGTLLYMASASPNDSSDTTLRLMSTPAEGGARSTLMMGSYYYACGAAPSSSCVVSELKDKQLKFSHLDPVKGRGEEIARLDGYQSPRPEWDLSPDGSRLAIVDEGQGKGEIRMLSLADRKVTVLPIRDWKWHSLQKISWAADGKNLFGLTLSDSSFDLLLIDARGNPRVLYNVPIGTGWIASIVPSPDGRSLTFTKRSYVYDVVLVENF